MTYQAPKITCKASKMTKILAALLVLFLVFTVFGCAKKETSKAVTLTMGSWRADDVAQITQLLNEYGKINPNVKIEFKPTNPPDYNATLRLQLESGTGPDLFYSRSYSAGESLYTAGYAADVSAIAGLKTNFTAGSRAPWTATDGKEYAVPFNAIVQPIFYNKALFAQAGVSIPTTWQEFLAVCDKLQKAGITPLANGVKDQWDILECFTLAIVPGFIGGSDARLAYEAKKTPLNDAKMTSVFQAMADVAKYLPKGYEAISYDDSNALFATGKAAMYFDGSWSVGTFDDVKFEVGVFAPPSPQGSAAAICFHPDTGITYNKATKYKKECEDFLAWLCTVDGAQTAAKYMPSGFYPMINAKISIPHKVSNEILALTQGKSQDVRFVWPKFMDSYQLMDNEIIAAMRGQKTAKQAADAFAAGVKF